MNFRKRIAERMCMECMDKAKMSPEAQKFVHKHISHHEKDLGMPQEQAVKVSLEEAREKGYKVPEAK